MFVVAVVVDFDDRPKSLLFFSLSPSSTSSSSSPTTFTTASCSSLPIRALSKSERARLTNKEEIFALLVSLRLSFHTFFTRQDKRRKRIYTFHHQTLSVLHAHTSPTHKQTVLYSHSHHSISVVVVVVRTHINCSVVVTLIEEGKRKSRRRWNRWQPI